MRATPFPCCLYNTHSPPSALPSKPDFGGGGGGGEYAWPQVMGIGQHKPMVTKVFPTFPASL